MNDDICTESSKSGKQAANATAPVETDEMLASLAKALAHPVRLQILRILAHNRACVCGDIVSELPLAQSTVSEHLRILKSAGLIIGEVSGPRVCYCIDTAMLDRFKSLVAGLPSPQRNFLPTECQEAQ